MPAPRRAGTKNTASALAQLDWLRVNRPRTYDRVMVAVAELVAALGDASD